MKEDKKVKNILQKYMQWPLVLSILVVCGNVAAVLVSPQAGALMAVFTVLYLGCAVFLFWYGRKRLAAGLISYAAEFTGSQKQLLASMELPYGIADTDGKILWMNRAFAAVVKEEKNARKNLPALFPEITKEALAAAEHRAEFHCAYKESRYHVIVKRFQIRLEDGFLEDAEPSGGSGEVFAVYLYDETEIHA